MTQQTQREYTWKDLEAAVGQDFSGGVTRTAADPVERGAIRKFCEVLELDCPLFHDDAVARQHGYDGVLAPVSMINSTLTAPAVWNPGDPTRWPSPHRNQTAHRDPPPNVPQMPMPRTNGGFATDIEIEYLRPVYVGDRLTSRGSKLVSVIVRETRVGYGAFTVRESEVVNQRGEVVAKARNGSYSYIVGAKAPQ